MFPGYNAPIYSNVESKYSVEHPDPDLYANTSFNTLPSVNAMGDNGLAFNGYDTPHACSRISFGTAYKVLQGIPMNPMGRTGLRGRGSLPRWGPNHGEILLVSRFVNHTQSISSFLFGCHFYLGQKYINDKIDRFISDNGRVSAANMNYIFRWKKNDGLVATFEESDKPILQVIAVQNLKTGEASIPFV